MSEHLITNEDNGDAERLITSGSDIAGAAIGGAVGFVALGPISAAAAGALGVIASKTLRKMLTDVASRQLSHREEVRVGATAAFALSGIKERLEAGQQLRTDDFLGREKVDSRSAAEEIFEGVLQKGKKEHEEKKVKLLGSFYANLAFTSSVSPAEANHYLRMAEGLTYRQLCVLAIIFLHSQSSRFNLRKNSYSKLETPILYETLSLLQEICDMSEMGLIKCRKNDAGYFAMLSVGNVIPNGLELTHLGNRMAQLLGVERIGSEDLDPILLHLSTQHENSHYGD